MPCPLHLHWAQGRVSARRCLRGPSDVCPLGHLAPCPPPLPTGAPCPAWRMVLTREGRGRGEGGGMRGNWPRHPQQSVPSPLPLFGGVVDPQQCVEPAGAIAEQSASPCDSPCERPLPAGSREGGGGGACARTLQACAGWGVRVGARAHKRLVVRPASGVNSTARHVLPQVGRFCSSSDSPYGEDLWRARRGEVLSTQVEWALSDTLRPSTSEYVHAIYRAVLSDFRCSHGPIGDLWFVLAIARRVCELR
jgi:hypothetical protein